MRCASGSRLWSATTSRLPWVSTFHSACARILRQEGHALGYDRNFSILDEGDSLTTIRRVLDDAALADSPPLELARARIEQAKNEAISPDEMLASAQPGREASIAQIYRLYQERMREMNAMDFSDLQLQTWILFERFPEILEKWQRRAAHLLVDEYQDTNRVQYLIVKALAARSGNLCVVGDEDQSIYRWRGADIRNILDFERDYPAAQIFKLEQNYRSTKTILAAAGGVIRNNTERKIKNLWTENGAGEPVTYYTGVTERDEADFIALEIARLTGVRRIQSRRRRRLLPRQCAVARDRRGARAPANPLLRRRRRALLRTARRQGSARLPARARESRRRRQPRADGRHAAARNWREVVRGDHRAGRARAHHGVRGDGPARNLLEGRAQNRQAGRDALFVDARSRARACPS